MFQAVAQTRIFGAGKVRRFANNGVAVYIGHFVTQGWDAAIKRAFIVEIF